MRATLPVRMLLPIAALLLTACGEGEVRYSTAAPVTAVAVTTATTHGPED